MNSGEEASYDPNQRIAALTEAASRIDIDFSILPSRYFRSGQEIIRMARVYSGEKDYEAAYILYMKYSILFVDKLPTHPDYKSASKEDLILSRKNLKEAIQMAETMKPILLTKFEQEEREWLEQQKIEKEKREKEEAELSEKQKEEKERKRLEDAEKIRKFQAMKQQQPTIAAVPSDPSTSSPSSPLKTSSLGRLRLVLLPSDLCSRFLQAVEPQTRNNVETCGILCGIPEQGRIRVTHLVIPKQAGTADACTTTQEGELFAVLDKQELITLGWIHTHPSQRAFLTSIDLHMQASYQALLPEAVAVVVAPKHSESGFFRLSESGLDTILRCRQPGLHPHDGEILFTQCQHIGLTADYSIQVVDLR